MNHYQPILAPRFVLILAAILGLNSLGCGVALDIADQDDHRPCISHSSINLAMDSHISATVGVEHNNWKTRSCEHSSLIKITHIDAPEGLSVMNQGTTLTFNGRAPGEYNVTIHTNEGPVEMLVNVMPINDVNIRWQDALSSSKPYVLLANSTANGTKTHLNDSKYLVGKIDWQEQPPWIWQHTTSTLSAYQRFQARITDQPGSYTFKPFDSIQPFDVTVVAAQDIAKIALCTNQECINPGNELPKRWLSLNKYFSVRVEITTKDGQLVIGTDDSFKIDVAGGWSRITRQPTNRIITIEQVQFATGTIKVSLLGQVHTFDIPKV